MAKTNLDQNVKVYNRILTPQDGNANIYNIIPEYSL
jgi:hypothetical protein